MRILEQKAIEELRIPSVILMENAASRLAEHCYRLISENKLKNVLIVCGSGNNGGDGLALARHLRVRGIDVKIIYTGDINANSVNSAKNGAALNLEIVKNMNIPLFPVSHNDDSALVKSLAENCDLLIDAMLGTGLDRDVEGIYKSLTETINRYAKYVVSVDIPSGVHSDSGRIMGYAVEAKETVTFCLPKIGLYAYPGAQFAGKIHVEDISIPHSLTDGLDIKAEILTDREAHNLLPARKPRSNKGDYGKILVFAGSAEMPGAAALTCSASYMAGAGLVCACAVPQVASVIHHWQREVITRNVPEKNGMYCKESIEPLREELSSADVIIIGPGIGRSCDVTEFVHELIKAAQAPLVLDADALFALSENPQVLKTLRVPCLITPHPGEMSRLTGLSVSEILDDIAGTALRFAEKYNVVTLLKDAHTIIAAPNGRYNINITGNNALSKAGTGDVLTGMIAGFAAQGADVFTAGVLGAYFHGRAGEAAAARKSCYGVTAEDILAEAAILTRKDC